MYFPSGGPLTNVMREISLKQDPLALKKETGKLLKEMSPYQKLPPISSVPVVQRWVPSAELISIEKGASKRPVTECSEEDSGSKSIRTGGNKLALEDCYEPAYEQVTDSPSLFGVVVNFFNGSSR